MGFPVGKEGWTPAIDNAKAPAVENLYTTHKHRVHPDNSQKGMNTFHGEAHTMVNFVMWSNRNTTVAGDGGAFTYSNCDSTDTGLGAEYSFQKDNGIYQWELTDRLWNHIKFTVSNPKIMLSCLDVELTVNILL